MNEERPFYKKGWFIIPSAIFFMIIIGNLGGPDKATETKNKTEDPNNFTHSKGDFSFYDLEDKATEYTYKITGKIKNKSGHDLDYVQITFKIYDKNKNLMETAISNIKDLSDGEVWSFEVPALINGNEVASYRIAEIVGRKYNF